MKRPNPNETTIPASSYYSKLQKREWPVESVDVAVDKLCDCVYLSRIQYGDEGASIWLTYEQFDAIVRFVKKRRPRKGKRT